MVTLFVVVLMAKTLLSSAPLTRAATAWIRTGRRQAAMVPAGRGVLRLCHQLLSPPVTLRVLMLSRLQLLLPPVLERISMSSHRSSGRARRPCSTGGNGVIFAGRSDGAGEEAGGAGGEAGGASSSTAPQISRPSPFVMSLTS